MNNWEEYFEYKEGSLYWKKITSNRARIGNKAGRVKPDSGYIAIGFFGREYREHRIIWEMFNGPIPEGYEIDHINHIKSDNRLENLRLTTHYENSLNQPMHKDNSSGVCGVGWFKSRKKWKAYIGYHGKCITLGYFDNFEDAVNARRKAEMDIGYHKNHGGDHVAD
ncbi:HNH endonuclease signature motif containing protein [Escherichia coli]|uniref:HNH endonuclease signature motif containing protein n=1 Tax=Escherichia coli TaxID=562 RepID=UPI0028798B91|nr:HNH endonuclease signature motif containing protein [Escherichia coli]MDS1650714.1 HNH endonuclease signature motif containing protein [Escherichia coli]